jgi:hypothetical protein
VRASDTVVETILYRDWLRGLLGSADSPTAQKYGMALYRARALNWTQTRNARSTVAARNDVISRESDEWEKVAEQIRAEDPEAYQYLQGTKGFERIGAGFIALLSAILFGFFDITASVLILLGFVLFRWAVIAAPLVGTVGILRPASAGFRRLTNAVVAALFNIVIFGTGAATYLFAVDLITGTTALPGWLQVVLIGLTGVAAWMLLRPFRRVTQLAGGTSAAAALIGRRPQAVATEEQGAAASAGSDRDATRRVEVQPDPPAPQPPPGAHAPARVNDRRSPVPTGEGWSEPAQAPFAYPIYRPSRPSRSAGRADSEPARANAGLRAEARRET